MIAYLKTIVYIEDVNEEIHFREQINEWGKVWVNTARDDLARKGMDRHLFQTIILFLPNFLNALNDVYSERRKPTETKIEKNCVENHSIKKRPNGYVCINEYNIKYFEKYYEECC